MRRIYNIIYVKTVKNRKKKAKFVFDPNIWFSSGLWQKFGMGPTLIGPLSDMTFVGNHDDVEGQLQNDCKKKKKKKKKIKEK